jgi:hypothetical protein
LLASFIERGDDPIFSLKSMAMKTKVFFLFSLAVYLIYGLNGYSQFEVKSTGTTSATNTFLTKNGNSDTSMLIRDDGRIGIGTTAPTQKLEVNGIIYSKTGGFKCPDGTMITTAPTSYAKVFTVAISGGDFTSIQSAILACAGAGKNNTYLVRVMPGIYNEPSVICKKYVDLSGSGKYSCTINGTVTGADSCVIENLNILNGILCNGTSPFIINNIITRKDSPYAIGIDISNFGNPWIKENEIVDCNGYGIYCNGIDSASWITSNKILRNSAGGIRCQNSSPRISNNLIDFNSNYGIYLAGASSFLPCNPTIDDNVISHTTNSSNTGIGISISFYSEPRIISNDIYLNDCGIEIDPPAQPSILSNNINYNTLAGIRCQSNGFTKRVVIIGNHIHSNTGPPIPGLNSAGIWIGSGNPVITQNNISQNRRSGSSFPDIDYAGCSNPFYPMISLNVYDYILRSGTSASGNYNVTSAGAIIQP